MATKQGCVFCGDVARKRTTINVHLDQYVPEIAKARRLKLLSDPHHHVAIIRHGRYPVRAKWDPKNQPKQKEWKLETEPLLRALFVEFGKRMVVPILEKAGDDHVTRSWELVSVDFWNESAYEAVQELQKIADEDLHDDHITQFVDNVFKDLEKTWKMEIQSEQSDASPVSSHPVSPASPLPARKARRTNNNIDGDVHGDVITGFLVQSNGDARSGATVHRQRPASPGTPGVPIGILLTLRVLVLGSTHVLVHLEQGTTLAAAIAEIVTMAVETMPELAHYAGDRLVLRGMRGAGPDDCAVWETTWSAEMWSEFVEIAEESRAPPKWSAHLVVDMALRG